MDIDLELIFNKKSFHERYENISYVSKDKKVISAAIDMVSARREFPSEDWGIINQKSVQKWIDKTSDFHCFFCEAIEINVLNETEDFLIHNRERLFGYENKLFLTK